MFFGTGFRSSGLPFCERIVCRPFRMPPVYAVIFRASCAGSITRNWHTASMLREITPNTYAKKFDSSIEAQQYIDELNFKRINIVGNAEDDEDKNDQDKNEKTPGVKRKLSDTIDDSVRLVIKEHIKKIKMSFNDLQEVLVTQTGLPARCVQKLTNLNEKVFGKINKMLSINLTEYENTPNKRSLHSSQPSTSQSDSSSSNINDSNLLPTELEAAKKSLMLNKNNEVIVFTDGACSNNGRNGASAGAGIWFGENHPLNLSVKVPGVQTNNNAEIFSTIKAIERIKDIGLTKINIHTDSEFVIKSVNEWIPRWKNNGWKTSAGSAVKNKDMFIMLIKKMESMDSVNWTYVPGHKGIVGNEEADKLARLGAKI